MPTSPSRWRTQRGWKSAMPPRAVGITVVRKSASPVTPREDSMERESSAD
jgi:hypothetical protein